MIQKVFHIICLLIFSLSIQLKAQNIEVLKEHLLSDTKKTDYTTILNLGMEGFILGGHTLNTKKGDADFIITRTDRDYGVVWTKQIGEHMSDKIFCSSHAEEGETFLFMGLSIDEKNNYANFNAILINKQGKVKWRRKFMGNPHDEIRQIIKTKDKGFAIIGSRESKGDHDMNMWVLRLDKKGNKLWQTYYGERFYHDYGYSIVETPDEGFLALGATYNSSDNKNVYLVKIDRRGNEEWHKNYGGTNTDIGLQISKHQEDDYHLVGITSSKGNGGKDVWIISVDHFGNINWDQTYGNFEEDTLIAFKAIDKDKFILSTLSENTPVIYLIDDKGQVLSENYLKSHSSIQLSEILTANETELLVFANQGDKTKSKDAFMQVKLTKNKPASKTNSNKTKGMVSVGKDITPPYVEIISPILEFDFATLAGNSNIEIKGTVQDDSGVDKLYMNDKTIRFDERGFFNIPYNLKEGINELVFVASDRRGNKSQEKISLEFTKSATRGSLSPRIGRYNALLISVNDYIDDGINDLDNPVVDAQKLQKVLLEKYSFSKDNIKFLKNPTRVDIITALEEYAKKLTPEDNLIIFYAGHGYWDPQTQTGFWLPSDAQKGNTANWLRNSTLRDFINGIKTRHTLLIADACFSGGIFKTRKAFSDAAKSINSLYEVPSRKAMTSGALKEVPDKSVFIQYLLNRLENNKKKYISSEELFISFRTAVINNSSNLPQFGEIRNTGDEGGDFIFIQKK